MDTIWKFEIKTVDKQIIRVPEGAKFLTAQTQRSKVCLWALVNSERPLAERVIETFGTGHPMQVDMGVERSYIGSYQLLGGDLVFHVFERLS